MQVMKDETAGLPMKSVGRRNPQAAEEGKPSHRQPRTEAEPQAQPSSLS